VVILDHKMGRYVVITLKISPSDVDVDLEKINEKVKDIIKNFGANIYLMKYSQ